MVIVPHNQPSVRFRISFEVFGNIRNRFRGLKVRPKALSVCWPGESRMPRVLIPNAAAVLCIALIVFAAVIPAVAATLEGFVSVVFLQRRRASLDVLRRFHPRCRKRTETQR